MSLKCYDTNTKNCFFSVYFYLFCNETFIKNSCYYNGSAIYISKSSTITTIYRSTFISNTAEYGIIYIHDRVSINDTFMLELNEFRNNILEVAGSIYMKNVPEVELRNT